MLITGILGKKGGSMKVFGNVSNSTIADLKRQFKNLKDLIEKLVLEKEIEQLLIKFDIEKLKQKLQKI